MSSGRVPEAAVFARTYLPSRVPEVVQAWKEDLGRVNRKAADALASPADHPDLFPESEDALQVEQIARQLRARQLPASSFSQHEGDVSADIMSLIMGGLSVEDAAPAPQHHQEPVNGLGAADHEPKHAAPAPAAAPVGDGAEEEEAGGEDMGDWGANEEPTGAAAAPAAAATAAAADEEEEEEDDEDGDVNLNDDWGLDDDDEEEEEEKDD